MFLRSWYPVAVPQLYNPVTSLLMPVGQKDGWTGMRTLGQLKQDLNVHHMPNKDSLYKVKRRLLSLDNTRRNEKRILEPIFKLISIHLPPDDNITQ